MPGTFNLSPEQQATWSDQLPELRRGLQTEIAKVLERKRHGGRSSWKTQLSAFFQGKEKGLKAVFEHPARLEIVAKHIGATPTKLKRWLDIATGVPVQDEPGLVRVPGFEDYGALPASQVYFPPKLREARFHLPTHGLLHSSGGGNLDLDKLVEVATSTAEPAVARAIVVVGGRGVGRSPTLEAIAQRLIGAGLDVWRWQSGQPVESDGVVLLIDDLDELDASERASALSMVKAANALVVCAVGFDDHLLDLPAERAIIEIAEGDEPWARAYLEHLAGPVAEALARQINTEPIREWLSDEPDTTAFLNRADTLGLLARHVADGGEVPLPEGHLLELVIRRWAHLLRRDGRGPEALTVELCLPGALAHLARAACRNGRWSHRLQDVAGALVEVAGNRLAGSNDGVWRELGAPGMLAVVDALEGHGFFVRRGGELEPVQQILQGAALGHVLHKDPDDLDTLGHAVADSRWHAGILVAAGLAGDTAPMLAALEALPLGPRVHSYALVTRLLASSVNCSDTALLRRWFRRCLLWWASTPPESRSVTMTIGSGSAPQRSPANEALIGGSSPLLVLARASKMRRGFLSGPSSKGDLLDGDGLPEDERRYLKLLSRQATDESLDDALLVGAPYQCDLILDPARWAKLPSATMRGHELPGGLTREEYGIWWRTVAAPRLKQDAAGRSMVAGTATGWSVTWSMCQTDEPGTRLWSDALAAELDDGAEGAPAAFGEAVSYVMEVGGLANFNGICSVWASVKGRRRRAVLKAVAEALPRPETWFLHDTFIPWILRELLQHDELHRCWAEWRSASGQTLARMPWKAFLEARLPATDVMSWAIETLPESPRAAGKTASRIPTTGTSLVMQFHEARDAPQAAILDHLVELADPEVLEALLAAPQEWSQKAWKRLEETGPDRARVLRLQWAAASDDAGVRMQLIGHLVPQPGEFELWKAAAQTSPNWHESLVRWVQAAACNEGEERWLAANEALSVAEELVGSREAAAESIGEMFAADVEEVSAEEAKQSAQELVEQLHDGVPALLQDLGSVLAQAPDPDDGHEQLVRRLFAGPLRPLVRGHQGLWSLAWRVGGFDYVTDLLVTGNSDDDTGAATLERLYTCVSIGLIDGIIRPLLLHNVLGRSSTLVFANRIAPRHDDLMREALDGQPVLDAQGRPDPATAALARKLASVNADDAVRWVEQATQDLAAANAAQWWEALLPAVGPGRARMRSVSAWADCVARVA